MRQLVTLVRSTDCLSSALSTWLGMQGEEGNAVLHRLVACQRRPASRHEAKVLDVAIGSTLDYRQGELWAELGGVATRIAVANGLLAISRIPHKVMRDLKVLPLGLALQKVGVRRQTDFPVYERVPDVGGGTRLVAKLTATLLVGGRPWALTDEVIDEVVVAHRVPGAAVLPDAIA